MAYSEFTLKSACQSFGLSLDESIDLHRDVAEVAPSALLSAILVENVPLGTLMNTEKARSELIVAPVLIEVRRLARPRVSLFSGIDFDVDRARGLVGVCDFLLARSPHQSYLAAPAVAVVEAKRDDIQGGLGQCASEMVAARLFNEREGTGPSVIHGVVTTGSLWRFMALDGQALCLDQPEYTIAMIGKILGALLHCVGEAEPTPVLA